MSNTIFVSLITVNADCLQTLTHLFRRATCPMRVFVGVVEWNPNDEYACTNEFGRLYPEYSANVRSYTTRRQKDRGWQTLRHIAQTQLYSNEHFTCLIDHTTQLCEGWDEKLIQMYMKLHTSNAVITTILPTQNLLLGSKPTYMVFERYSDGLPTMQAVTFDRMPTRSYRSVGWTSTFSFGPSRMFDDVPFDKSLRYVRNEADSYMAMLLNMSGWTFYTPTCAIGISDMDDKGKLPSKDQIKRWRTSIDAIQYAIETLSKDDIYHGYVHATGTDVAKGKASVHAFLGVHRDVGDQEVIEKFGSLHAFRNIKMSVKHQSRQSRQSRQSHRRR